MNNTSLIIGIALLVVSILPFLFLNRKANKQKKIVNQAFQQFIKENNGNVSKSEYWENRMIALDLYSDRVFYLSKIGEEFQRQIIDLSKTVNCTIDSIINESTMMKSIEEISLRFVGRQNENISVNFFDQKLGSKNLNGEVQLSKKWADLINTDLQAIS